MYGGLAFEGTLDATGIRGHWIVKGKVGQEERLIRGPGYWDR